MPPLGVGSWRGSSRSLGDAADKCGKTRREVVTYDGSRTASIVITQDGETTTCSVPLPRGRLSCGG